MNNSKQQQEFRERCRQILAGQASTGLPQIDSLVVDCRDPKYRAGAQCQACLGNPTLPGCDKLIGIPAPERVAPQQAKLGGGPNASPLSGNPDFSDVDALGPEDLDRRVEPDAGEANSLNAGQGGGGSNVPNAASGGGGSATEALRARGWGGDGANFDLGDPQGFAAIGGGFSSYFASRGARRDPSSAGGATATNPIDWSKYLPGGAQYQDRRAGGMASWRGQVHGVSTDIFQAVSDRYYSLCKRRVFIENCAAD
jgi:hypothetical protein